MKINLFSLCFCLFLFVSCNSTKPKEGLQLSTNEEALKHYNRGWVQILDEGNYGPSEVSYRAALAADPDFLIGQTVLARLTLDKEEQLALHKNINAKKENITGDERLILDVFIGLLEYGMLRDKGATNLVEARKKVLKLAENNFRQVVHKYPEVMYLKSEYIEMLNANYGPQQALDTLKTILLPSQKDNLFLLGYAATMESDLGNFTKALTIAEYLDEMVSDPGIPKPDAVYAYIYLKMDSLQKAKFHADKANTIDFRNMDASRLKTRIDAAIHLRDSLAKTH